MWTHLRARTAKTGGGGTEFVHSRARVFKSIKANTGLIGEDNSCCWCVCFLYFLAYVAKANYFVYVFDETRKAATGSGCDRAPISSDSSRSERMCGTSIVRPPPLADGKEPLVVVKERKKEKRRNSEKRKEKSRDAARCRRGKESEIFNEMLSYLPLTEEIGSQLDKMSILRLALVSLRLNKFVEAADRRGTPTRSDDQWLRFGSGKDALCDDPILELMAGFLMVLIDDGESLEPIFVSEGVHVEMGLLPAELLGVSLESFVHPCDYQELREIFADLKAASAEHRAHRTLQVRMKCTITAKGRVVNIKSAAYKVVKYQLRLVRRESSTYLTAVCEPMGPFMAKLRPTKAAFLDTDVRGSDDFVSQHDLRFVFRSVERLPLRLGYSQEDLRGQSLYDVIHPQDMATLVDHFKELFSKGYCDTGFYRFLASCGGFCWVSTRAQLVQDTYGKPLTVHCVHSVLGDIRQRDDVLAQFQQETRQSRRQSANSRCAAEATPITVHTRIIVSPDGVVRGTSPISGFAPADRASDPPKCTQMSLVLPPLQPSATLSI
ncbi:hypothetical protein BIW11_03429, partial [Tropilaelaps mercedesae]